MTASTEERVVEAISCEACGQPDVSIQQRLPEGWQRLGRFRYLLCKSCVWRHRNKFPETRE